MLSLQLKSGEYLTIGDDIVVQVFEQGGTIRVAVKAPVSCRSSVARSTSGTASGPTVCSVSGPKPPPSGCGTPAAWRSWRGKRKPPPIDP